MRIPVKHRKRKLVFLHNNAALCFSFTPYERNNSYRKNIHMYNVRFYSLQQQLYHIPTKFMCIGLSPLNVALFVLYLCVPLFTSFSISYHFLSPTFFHSVPHFKNVHSPSRIFFLKYFNMRVLHVSVSTLHLPVHQLRSASRSYSISDKFCAEKHLHTSCFFQQGILIYRMFIF